MKTNYLLYLLLLVYSFSSAQVNNQKLPQTVKGIVVDKTNGTSLPFAYVTLKKVGLGTVTDGDGNFKITIPDGYNTNMVTISYLGFQDLNLTVAQMKARSGKTFSLQPEMFSLEEVVLEKPEKMPRAKALLKKVIKNIPENYTDTITKISGYYRETMKENGVYIKYTDAACEYNAAPYQKKRYKWRDYLNPNDFSFGSGTFNFAANDLHRIHFHHRTLKNEQVKIIDSRSSSNLSKRAFQSNIEGGPLSLFARNRVKYQESFLGRKATSDFTYNISEEIDEKGTWLYVLDFHTKTTKEELDKLESTNNRRQWRKANKHKLLKGKIYINQEDLAVVKYECAVPNDLKKYFCGYGYNEVKHFDYKLDVSYKKKGNKYFIDKLRHEDEFIYQDSISQTTTYYSAISEFDATAITTEDVKKIAREDNFANTVSNQLYEFPLEYNSDFWENYTEENAVAIIDTIIRGDMESKKSLEQQFKDKHIRNDSLPAPLAAKVPSSFKIHKETYTDDYAWLKDTKNPKQNKPVMDYLREENAYAVNYNIPLKKSQRTIYKQLVRSLDKNSVSLPVEKNGYSYYSRYNEDDEYPIYYRKAISNNGATTKEEEILNVNELVKEKEFYSASTGSVSPNNELITVFENTTGTDEYTLKIKDLKTNSFLKDSINRIGNVIWLDDTRFLYTNVEKDTYRSSKVMQHTLGTDAKNDLLIYEEKDTGFGVSIRKSKSKKYIFLNTSSSTSSEIWYLKTDQPNDLFSVIKPRKKNHLYAVLHHKDHFYIITNKDAINFKVVKVAVHDVSEKNWEEVIPQQEGVLIQGLQIFDKYIAVSEKEKAQSRIKIINLETNKSHFIKIKEDFYNISMGYNPDFATDSLQYSYSSFETPFSTYKYNMKTKKKRLVKQHSKPIEHPFNTYVIERKWVTAKDGKQIPLTLIKDKWLSRHNNNKHKVYLTSYGSYGAGQEIPSGAMAHHLVNSGYIYAIAHVRGGDDMGNEWYEDGKLFNKKNTFTDFIDCAEYLIAEDYAKKGSIVAQGGSAGGLLMGAVANERPELFNTIILNVPFVDVINTMLDEKLPLTTGEFEEWGNPKDKAAYNYIKSYSPYDNVTAQAYPNMLFFTGLNDTRVGYWEPAKMAAKLRATKTDDKLLLLKTSFSNGHGGGSGRYARYRDNAYQLALIYELDKLARKDNE
ncbi:Oligopeptidase B [unidentified eubacterium SCB49]|nr:Oligopeptidase B [unidentified eubacterium SCB49]